MAAYTLIFFYGWAMLLSFIGFGWLVTTLLLNHKSFAIGTQAVFGVIVFLLVGGYLDFFKVVSPTSLLSVIGVGLLIFIYALSQNYRVTIDWFNAAWRVIKSNKQWALVLGLVLLLIIFRYALAVAFFPFHTSDDYQGYLVFPEKMIQTGQLGNDPFSERRIVSSLGGSYLLSAAVLAVGSLKNLHLIDHGLGVVMLLLVLIELLTQLKLRKWYALLVVLLVVLIPSPSGNVTSFFLAAAIFLALFRLVYFKEKISDWRLLSVVGFLTLGLVILKTNLVIPALALYGCFFIFCFYLRSWKIWLPQGLIIFALAIIALAPWLLSMLASSGTLFYPFLGPGFYGTRYGNFAGHFMLFNIFSLFRLITEFISSINLFIPLFILLILIFRRPAKNKFILGSIALSCLLGIVAVIYGVGGYSLYYYTFPFVLPTVIFLLTIELADSGSTENPTADSSVYPLLLAVLMVGLFIQKDLGLMTDIKASLSFDQGIKVGLINTELVTLEERQQFINLQNSIPAQATLLARLDKNFVFDFRRNNVFIIDLPGGSSLPPGLPFRQGGERLADYLLSVGIQYVAYSYGNEANFSKQGNSGMLRAHVNPWLKAETEHSFDFQDSLMELAKSRKIIYDDGKNFVLDLSLKQ